jgi:hypothetical protein
MRGGDHERAQFAQGNCAEPIFIAALEDQHDGVALFDAQILEHIGGAVGVALNLLEREGPLVASFIAPYKGAFVRRFGGICIDDIVAEVKVLRYV